MKKFIFAFLIFFIACNGVYALEENISDQIDEYGLEKLDGYESGQYFSSGLFSENVKSFASGKEVINTESVLKKIIRGFLSEASSCSKAAVSIIVISLLYALLSNISDDFSKSSVGNTAFFACYLFIAQNIAASFADAASLVMMSVRNISGFIGAAVPVIITMLISCGGYVSASSVNTTILFASETFAVITEKLLLPSLYSSAVLYIVSSMSENIKLSKFADFLKKSVKWILCLILTVFVGVLTVQAFAGAALDSLSAKTAKYIVSGSVPVVGSILSDTIETVVGCSILIKNSAGAAAIVAVLAAVSVPIIKILALSITFYLGAALVEPVCDKRISDVMSSVASITTIMAAIVITAGVIFIICIGTLMCINGGG